MGTKQSTGEMSQADVLHSCEELELLLARAQSIHKKMVARGLAVIRPSKVAARERGYDNYATYLDGIEKAVFYPAPEANGERPDPARKARGGTKSSAKEGNKQDK